MEVTTDDFLAHFGVKGMKWGKHKSRTTVELVNNTTGKSTHVTLPRGTTVGEKGNLTSTTKRSAKKATAALDAGGVRNLSDTELRQRINRIQMEKQYAQLTSKETSRGQKVATDFVKDVGKQVAAEYAKKYAKQGIDIAVKAAFSKK